MLTAVGLACAFPLSVYVFMLTDSHRFVNHEKKGSSREDPSIIKDFGGGVKW